MSKIDELSYQLLNEEFTEYDSSFKIIVVGDSGVGKSCLTLRATKIILKNLIHQQWDLNFLHLILE